MARYLATFNDNHGEEFDVHGFRVMTEKEVTKLEELAASITWEFEFYASSESLTYTNGEDLLSRISFKEISKDEYETLKKVFGDEFGLFIGEEYLETILNSEEGEEEKDEEEEDY
jgi:hypothetical protein